MRALVLSLAASLGLHGGALSWVFGEPGPGARLVAPTVPLIEVSLSEPMVEAVGAPSMADATGAPVAGSARAPRRISRPRGTPAAADLAPAEQPSGEASPDVDDSSAVQGDEEPVLAGAAASPSAGCPGGSPPGETRPLGVHTGDGPGYPASAREAGVQGTTRVKLLVSIAGTVAEAVVIRSSGSQTLDDAAVAALSRWRFEPALRNGQPVAAQVVVPVVFSLR